MRLRSWIGALTATFSCTSAAWVAAQNPQSVEFPTNKGPVVKATYPQPAADLPLLPPTTVEGDVSTDGAAAPQIPPSNAGSNTGVIGTGRFNPAIDFGSNTSSAGMNVPAPLIETPRTVNVLTEAFLDATNNQDLNDILTYVPGASSGGRGGVTNFSIRGFGGLSINNPEDNTIYIDNFRVAGRRYHYDPALFERVEILKGPGSLLYGTASPGGTVRYITKRPDVNANSVVEATLGNFDHARGMLDLTGAVNESQTVAYRFITTGFQANSTDHGSNDDVGRYDRAIINPQISWATPTGGQVYFSYEYSKTNTPLDPGTKQLLDGSIFYNSPAYFGPQSFSYVENSIGTLEFTQPLGESWEFFAGARMGKSLINGLWDVAWDPDGAPWNPPGESERFVRRFREEFEQQEVRVQLTGQVETGIIEHNLTLGWSYLWNETPNVTRGTAFPGTVSIANPVFPPTPVPPMNQGPFSFGGIDETGVYLQDYASIGDRLHVFGGLRYIDAQVVAYDEGSDSALDYSIGGIYNACDLINPFIGYSTCLTPQWGLLGPDQPVPFRSGKQIEGGIKSQWFDGNLLTTASVFHIEQTNIAQANIPDDGFLNLLGDQATTGFEFEAVGRLSENFNLYGGYSYLDARFLTSTQGLEGLTPLNVPTNKFAFFLQYMGLRGNLQGLVPGFGMVYVNGRYGDNENTFDLPDYARFDLSLAYRDPCERYYLQANIENIFNTNYVDSAEGTGSVYQGAPIYLTVRAGLNF